MPADASYLNEWRVPGTDLTVGAQMMLHPAGDRAILAWVLDRAGVEAATLCALEMRRRRRAHHEMVGDFLRVLGQTGSVQAAAQGVLGRTGDC